MDDSEIVLALVQALHEAPHREDGWAEFLALARHLLATDWAHLHVDGFHEDGRPFMCLEPFTTTGLRAYAEHYRHRDPRNPVIFSASGVPAVRQQMVSDRAFRRSEIYTDFLHPQGTSQIMVLPFASAGGDAAFFCLTRPEQAGPFQDDEAALLRPLAGALRVALEVERQLGRARRRQASLAAALDAGVEAVLALAGDATVRFANATARSLLDTADGLSLDTRGRLCTAYRRDQARLDALLAVGVRHPSLPGAGEMLVLRPSGRDPYLLRVAPLPPEHADADVFGSSSAGFLVLVHDPGREPPAAAERARKLFALTGAELAVAQAIGRGVTLREHAEQRGVSYETVRVLLKRVFRKTGTRSQAALVRRLHAYRLV